MAGGGEKEDPSWVPATSWTSDRLGLTPSPLIWIIFILEAQLVTLWWT